MGERVEEGEEKSRPSRRESQGKEGRVEVKLSERISYPNLSLIPSLSIITTCSPSFTGSISAAVLSSFSPCPCRLAKTAYIDQGYPDVTAKLSVIKGTDRSFGSHLKLN